MKKFLKYIFLFSPIITFGQYPFEKFKHPKSLSLKFKETKNEEVFKCSTVVKSFFTDKSDLEIVLNEYLKNEGETYIEIKTTLKSRKYFEDFPAHGNNGIVIADFNGDGKKDFKIFCSYMGCGIAALNIRTIYYFQKENKDFTKISFDDKYGKNIIERDIDGDGNFEIITKKLQDHKTHNYWLFNLYNFVNNDLVCVNDKMNYPIMIQYLFRENYKVTKNLTSIEMKNYELKRPEELLIEN
jgi:hypothetical protein